MEFKINPSALFGTFPCPKAVAEKLNIASLFQLRVILCLFSDFNGEADTEKLAEALKAQKSEVEDALLFWSKAGVLIGEEKAPSVPKKSEIAPKAQSRPTRGDVARRGLEDKQLNMILNEAQMKFGRNLKVNESSSIVWIYDDLGLSASVMMLLLQYAVSENRLNITFLEKTALAWYEAGVENVADAEGLIRDNAQKNLAWSRIERAFGIERRKPSDRELSYAVLWLSDWKISDELLKAAYNECIDRKGKLYMGYISAILEKWHKSGIKSAADIEKAPHKGKEQKSASFATYNLDLFEQKLNSDD